MASFRLTDSQTFREGATVKVWPTRSFAPSPPQKGQVPPPNVSPTAEGTFTGGALTLSGLADGTPYSAGVLVSSVWEWVGFFTPPAEEGGSGPSEPGVDLPTVEALVAASNLIPAVNVSSDHLLAAADASHCVTSTKETGELKVELRTAAELVSASEDPFVVGSVFLAWAKGAAALKLVAKAGVTLLPAKAETLVPAGKVAWIRCVSANVWSVEGAE